MDPVDLWDPKHPQKAQFEALFKRLGIQDEAMAELFVQFLITMLENMDREREQLFLYRLLAEVSVASPHIIRKTHRRLVPRLKAIISSSHSVGIVEAVYRILEAGIGSEDSHVSSSSKSSEAEPSMMSGFGSLVSSDKHDFMTISRSQTLAVAQVLSLYAMELSSVN